VNAVPVVVAVNNLKIINMIKEGFNMNNGTIKLNVPVPYYMSLTEEQKELYTQTDQGIFFVEFPVEDMLEEEYIGTYVIACVEAALIIPNPKYAITSDTNLRCELLKLGKTGQAFNILLHIKYAGVKEEFNDIMLFQEVKVEEDYFEFEYLGDQTLFSIQ
jgi:hypothetical protein